MKKEYFNQEAYNYIESRINKTKINPVFKPIIIDIILRRRHEYQLDDKYFHRDVQSFIRNVKGIYWKKLPKDRSGDFCPSRKCIRLNADTFENMNDEQFAETLFDVLSHECGHALNCDILGYDRTFREEAMVNSGGMMESFTEKTSNRLTCNRKPEDAFKYFNKTYGYTYITKYVDAIALAFGIKEKDLLSAYIKGRQELYEVLNANLKDNKFSKNIFEDISFNINLAHIEFSKVYKDKADKIKFKNIWNSLKFIYRDMEQILAYRIENLEWDNLEELQEKLEDIKLSQNAISKIMEGPIVKEKDKETVKKLAMSGKRMVYAKVMCMEEIIKSKGESSRELISFVQNSESVDEILEFMKQNGIEIDSEKLALMPEFELSEQKKDEWVEEYCLDGKERDNTEIYNYEMANREEIENAKERFFDRVKMAVYMGKREIRKRIIDFPLISVALLRKRFKYLRRALPKKEKPLLLGERRKRKNRRQKIVGCI